PPLIMIGEWNFVIGWRENNSACYKIFSRRSRKFFLGGCAFSNRDVASRLNKLLELPIRHWSRIHPEAVYANAMNRSCIIRRHRHLFHAMTIRRGAHREFAARNPDHPFRCFAWRSRFIRQCWLECGTTFLCVKPFCQSRAETDNCNKSKNDSPHVSLRSLLRSLRRFPQSSC